MESPASFSSRGYWILEASICRALPSRFPTLSSPSLTRSSKLVKAFLPFDLKMPERPAVIACLYPFARSGNHSKDSFSENLNNILKNMLQLPKLKTQLSF